MDKKVEALIKAVKEGDQKTAEKLAEELSPPIHKTPEVQQKLAAYDFANTKISCLGADFHLSPHYNEILTFMKNNDGRGYMNLCRDFFDILDSSTTETLELFLLYMVTRFTLLLQNRVLPHLQELGLYPST